MNKLMNEMESQKELLLTYEQTLTHKDSIVANITDAIQKQVSSIFILTFLSSNRLSASSLPLIYVHVHLTV